MAAGQLRVAEEKLTQTTDPNERRQLEGVIKATKLNIEAMSGRQQQAQARETELAVQLQAKQNGLADLNERVNQLERALDEALWQLTGPKR